MKATLSNRPAVFAAPTGRLRLGVTWLALPALFFLAVFLVYPSLQLMVLGFEDAKTGAFTLTAFERAFSVGLYVRVLSSTFVVALETTLACLLLGYPLAYFLVHQPARRQRFLILLVMLPFWTSTLVKNFAWLVLLGRNGIIAKTAASLGYDGSLDLLFNRFAVVFGMTHSLLPLAVVSMLPVLSKIDRRLPLAGETLGASRAASFWQIYVPLSMPGVAAAGLLVFISALGFFITPALLGGPRETMLSQLIITRIQTLQDWNFAGALAVMLVVSALVACLLYDCIFGLASISGGATGKRRARSLTRRAGLRMARTLGRVTGFLAQSAGRVIGGRRLTWLLPAYVALLIAILLFPLIAIIPMGFTSDSFLAFPPSGFSLRWLQDYASSPVWTTATVRSFGIGFATALLTLLIALPAAFAVARSTSRWTIGIFLLMLAPMIVPTIVIATSLYYLYARWSLVATDLGIIIGHTVIALPIAFIIILATLKGHDWRLDQAAATLGATRPRVFRFVTLPLVQGGVAAAFIFSFLQSFDELTVVIFIGGGLKTTLPKQMWDSIFLQVSPTLAAASTVVLTVVALLFLVADRLQARRG